MHASAACNQAEVDEVFKAAKAAGKGWAKTPLWKRAEYLHKVAALMKANAQVRICMYSILVNIMHHHSRWSSLEQRNSDKHMLL